MDPAHVALYRGAMAMSIATPAEGSGGGVPVPGHETLVVVQQEWNGWRTATVRLSDLQEVRWGQPPGAPRPLLQARVACDSIRSGELPHACVETPAPHHLQVWVLKRHAAPSVFEELARRADAGNGHAG